VKRAAFLDRDGTIIRDADYLADPDGVELLPGAADGMRHLRDAGFALVIVTNQSGIARGLYAERDFRAVQQRLEDVLRAQGIEVDGVYHCPHHPDFTGPCDCRKPLLGMYQQAAAELGIDLSRSLFVGDRLKDVEPALETGGTGYLVRTGYGAREAPAAGTGVHVVADLAAVGEHAAREVDRRR
jgi:D-glycero-D-manno-heptose 1,7-bisphosphate phosphatase